MNIFRRFFPIAIVLKEFFPLPVSEEFFPFLQTFCYDPSFKALELQNLGEKLEKN